MSGAKPSDFQLGYLLAVANICHTHDQPTIAADVLGELMVDRDILDNSGLSDFDLEPLRECFAELENRERVRA